MKPHYISENQNITTRIFIPVQEWNSLKSEPSDTEKTSAYEVPDWHKEVVLKRIEEFENGAEDVLDLEDAMKEIEKDL